MRASVLILCVAAACGRSHRGPPEGPPVVPDDPAEARGEALFHDFCYQCHPGGDTGVGPALNDKPLPGVAIRTQIREGVGAMPAFGENLLSDRDVADLARYVQELRDTPPTYVSGRRPAR